ncbi:MAG: pitrilysin family protein [Candidatus Eremiobacteraeota bacterium]|nr:pitrilysin family protein [Candidatus Eremiobacteraeota bacterium]
MKSEREAPLALLLLMAFLWSLGQSPLPLFGAEPPVFKNILDNGLLLLVKPGETKDIVAVSIIIRSSVYDEEDQKVGIRSLLLELLQEKIAGETTAGGISLTELMGVMTQTESTADYIALNFVTTPRHYKKLLELVAKALVDPTISDTLFTKVKNSFVEKNKGGKGAFSTIYSIFLQNFYRYHPYKLSEEANVKGIENTDKKKAESFFASQATSDRIVIAIAGNVKQDEVMAQIKNDFSSLRPRKTTRVEVQWEPQTIEKELFLSSLSKMSWILLGFPAPSYGSPDYPAMLVLKTLLGDGLNSRLWVELREKRGLAYELGSYYPELEGPSHLLLYVITQPQNVIASRRLILNEIEDIRVHGVTPIELEDAKAKIFGGYLLSRESSKGQALATAVSEVIGGKYSLDVTLERKVEEVTSQDISLMINKYFQVPTYLVVRPPGAYYIDWFR